MHKATRVSTAAILITIGGLLILTGCGKSKAKREYEKAMREANADIEKMNARMKKDAEQQAKVQREIKQREADRLARAKREQAERDAREKSAEQDAVRESIADISKMVLKPSVAVSAKLRSFGAVTEFRGEDLQALQKLHANRDWNGLIKRLGFGPDKTDWLSSSSPGVQAANQAKWKLDRTDFNLFVRTRTALPFDKISVPESRSHRVGGIGHALFFVKIPTRYNRPEDEPFRWDASWDKHPDGNGYLHEWDTGDAEIFLMFGEKPINPYPDGVLQDKLDTLSRQYQEQARKLVQKKKLGELSETDLTSQISRLRSQVKGKLTALLQQY